MQHASGQYKEELVKTAKEICTPGKGILAADESTGTIGKRFDGISVENTHENRQAYRELLFTAPGIDEHISGVIMFDETVRDSAKDGKKFCEILRSRNIHCGIKVDCGLVNIGGTNDETATTGLDGLGKRCAEYYTMGCRFAKWRAVLKIGDGCPSQLSIDETAHSLARYGSICQQNGLVPIIEPEILIDGEHSIDVCAEVSERVFSAVMQQLFQQKLLIEGLLLKPNMVTPGASSAKKASAQEIAWYTVRTLSRTIVPALPGVCFLSGGQSEEQASLNLNEMNKLQGIAKPWALTFSYGRALQSSVLKAWQGKPENVAKAQEVLLERAKANGHATLGKYEGGSGSTESDFVANYRY
uniref:Fructose-bisphosphate aldolase n=1 Tax=Strombidium rassoulzadegani TaxID=1082188 RepID=A0A7S3CTI6_9SPIT|mmetsp:Transcript_7921/g.13290  ORF Transcript_7921/g.13290 Transcript_7921/m.13290 type:complete len:357 (+) Transcript_7921:36-1106(+)|eukprot:CAMPEP_0168620240 /NCGR_PEP_ID=MMETSP0449_2-20121227/7028_1 /TAXON_ID=1082188 /ORGANISM="Strombidium rassoulzadegani, Strain ras09" /LENGTH=356 /DNA_ID=CAMNT_0008661225 /DNA_START=9 /DNA_END=1079 /DNA_ORIENTATION=+